MLLLVLVGTDGSVVRNLKITYMCVCVCVYAFEV